MGPSLQPRFPILEEYKPILWPANLRHLLFYLKQSHLGAYFTEIQGDFFPKTEGLDYAVSLSSFFFLTF